MRPSEIEMFRPRVPARFADTSIRDRIVGVAAIAAWTAGSRACHTVGRIAVAALVCIAAQALAPRVHAATQGVLLFADRDLGDTLAQAVQALGSDTRRIEIGPLAIRTACATSFGPTPRLALTTRVPSRIEIDRCSETAAAEVTAVQVGRQAVALVTPANSPVWSISAAGLFRAIGQNSGETPHPATWSDVDPSYPHSPIGLLQPPSGSRAQRLFDSLILAPGCASASGARMPFELKNRITFCSAVRSDIPAAQRQGGAQDVATWAASAPPGQIAVVTINELRELDRRVAPLLLDGALPTAANIEDGRYPASEQVQLVIVVPRAADRARRTEAKALAFDRLAEASIGPAGRLAPAGLIPLPPPERIAARSQAVAAMGQP